MYCVAVCQGRPTGTEPCLRSSKVWFNDFSSISLPWMHQPRSGLFLPSLPFSYLMARSKPSRIGGALFKWGLPCRQRRALIEGKQAVIVASRPWFPSFPSLGTRVLLMPCSEAVQNRRCAASNRDHEEGCPMPCSMAQDGTLPRSMARYDRRHAERHWLRQTTSRPNRCVAGALEKEFGWPQRVGQSLTFVQSS